MPALELAPLLGPGRVYIDAELVLLLIIGVGAGIGSCARAGASTVVISGWVIWLPQRSWCW